MSKPEPRYMGGQAVLEGVMMRGETTWAVAVRTPEDGIVVDVRPVAGWSEKYRRIPILRGVMGLGESLALGYRALTWSANKQVPEEEQVSEKAMGFAVAFSMILFSALFLVLPAVAGSSIHSGEWLPIHLPFQLAEGLVRLGLFIGYLAAISLIKDIRRVFEYHGAEHKTIAAYENGVELTPEAADQFTTAHVRCGTNFLLTVMVVAIVVYTFIPTPNIWAIIVSRVVLIPVIAGLSYEVIRLAAKNMHRAWVRFVMKPGLWLQKLTTREPDLAQLEVAIASLNAVLTAEQKTEVESRAGIRVPQTINPLPAAGN
ncbi:MAG TPA: DUF1385 domain-containing protein [Acidimicrobiia bacterium]|nr:DUF1385 domain-containing protein [Acidimicrobiia bacterium]